MEQIGRFIAILLFILMLALFGGFTFLVGTDAATQSICKQAYITKVESQIATCKQWKEDIEKAKANQLGSEEYDQ